MAETITIDTLRQLVADFDARAALLATGDQELQAQQAQIAEQTQLLAAQASQIQAQEQHVAELTHDLAVLRGELITQDRLFESLPYGEAVGARWGLVDTLHQVAARLDAWSEIHARLFTPQGARQVMLQSSKLLQAQHDRLIGVRQGGG